MTDDSIEFAIEAAKAAKDAHVPRGEVDDHVVDAQIVVGAARDLPIVDVPWQGGEARRRLFDDPTFKNAKRGHFIHDADNDEAREAYKLAFADVQGKELVANIRAVRAAASRLASLPLPAPIRKRIRTIIDNYLDRARQGRESSDMQDNSDAMDTLERDDPDNFGPRVEKSVRRYDRGTLRKKPRYDESTNFLHFELSVTKAPAVFKYRNADGSIRREFRPAEHVFSEDNIERMRKSVLTLGHPPVKVTSKNVRRFSVGHCDGSKSVESDHFWTGGVLQDDEAIAEVRDGKSQTSAGYDCDLVFKPGVWVDGAGKSHPYDAIQTNHRHNHTALLEFGRAETTGASLDRMDAVQVTEEEDNMADENEKSGQRGDSLPTDSNKEKARINVGEISVDLPIEQAKLIADQRAVDQAKADTLEAERDKAVADLKAANEKLKNATSEEDLQKRVDAKRELLDKAEAFVTDAEAFTALKVKTDDEIKRACIVAANPDVKLDGKSEAYIEAMFDLLKAPRKDSMSRQGKTLLGAKSSDRNDGRDILADRINKSIDKTDSYYAQAIPGGMTVTGKTSARDDQLHG